MSRLRDAAESAVLRVSLALPRPVLRLLAGRPVVHGGQRLDPETQWMLRAARLVGHPAPESMPIALGREVVDRQARLAGGRQPIGEVRDLDVPGGAGPVGARLYEPRSRTGDGEPSPLLVFLHGGGQVYGGLDSHDAVCRFLAERADTRVLAVDYRLAPEEPYPAAVEDAWAAYRWAVEHAAELGADPDRLAVGGDSAGGYLSAVVALRAAAAGLPLRYQLLVYPVTDFVRRSESREVFGQGLYLTDVFIGLSELCYLGDDQDPRDPEVSIAFTETIPAGLAAALVVTAGFDPLRDEGEAWAARLAAEGVEVVLRRYPDLTHGFLNVVGAGRSQRAAAAEVAALLRAALHR